MRKLALVAIITTGVLALCIFIFFRKPKLHQKQVRVYFQDVQGLRAGAPVRLAGVQVGSVVGVRARPDLRANPAEVLISILSKDEINIPQDALVSVETSGVLGEPYLSIDVREATGPPIEEHGTLKAQAFQAPTTRELLEDILEVLNKRPCTIAPPEGVRQNRSPTGHTPRSSR